MLGMISGMVSYEEGFMEKKQVIFDVDDVIWNLNEKAAQMKGVDQKKLTCYSVFENPNLTGTEKQLILDAYHESRTFENISFICPVIELINDIYNNYPLYQVWIISNCATKDIADLKMAQLLSVLNVPEDRICMNVIDMATGHKKKSIPGGAFIFVDDSPYNIRLSDAVHNIMPARLHNDVLTDGRLYGRKVDRPENSEELQKLIMRYIREGII